MDGGLGLPQTSSVLASREHTGTSQKSQHHESTTIPDDIIFPHQCNNSIVSVQPQRWHLFCNQASWTAGRIALVRCTAQEPAPGPLELSRRAKYAQDAADTSPSSAPLYSAGLRGQFSAEQSMTAGYPSSDRRGGLS